MNLAICVLVNVSKYLDILCLEFITKGCIFHLTWVQAAFAFASCSAHPGSLDLTSVTFAAVICDAEDLCSVYVAYDPGVRVDLCIFKIVVPTPNVDDAKCTVLPFAA